MEEKQPLYRGSPSAECLYRDKTSIKTAASDRLVVAGHQLLRCSHGSAHPETVAGKVGVGSGDVVHVRKVLIARCGRVLFQVEVILALEVFLVDVLNKLAVRAGFVCATMSGPMLASMCRKDTVRKAYWARLSEREKALLHNGQT